MPKMFRSQDRFPLKRYAQIYDTPIVIAIDGPTASGKGTLAAKIAERLGFAYMDTGALYRGVAKTALDNGLETGSEKDALKAADILAKNYSPDLQNDPALRTEAVSKAASEVAAFPKVREKLLQIQKEFAAHPPTTHNEAGLKGAVLDGRDIGTVICPNAQIKLFIEASAEIRATRRVKQLAEKNVDADFDDVLKELMIRDGRDKSRKVAPTVPAEDAFILDTSEMNAAQVLAHALDIIRGYMIGAIASAAS
jgi:cytidylate kinase